MKSRIELISKQNCVYKELVQSAPRVYIFKSVENGTSDAWTQILSLLIFLSNPKSCFSDLA